MMKFLTFMSTVLLFTSIEAYSSNNESDLKNKQEKIEKLFSKEMIPSQKEEVLASFDEILRSSTGDEIIKNIESILSKLSSDTQTEDYVSILKALATVKDLSIMQDISSLFDKFFTKNVGEIMHDSIVGSLVKLKNMEDVQFVTEIFQKQFTEKTEGREKDFILEKVINVTDPALREILLLHADKPWFIAGLMHLDSVEKLQNFMQVAPPFFTENMDETEKFLTIGGLAYIEDLNKLKLILQHAPKLFTEEMDKQSKAEIIIALDKVKDVEILEFIAQHMPKLFTEEVKSTERAKSIVALSEREDIKILEATIDLGVKFLALKILSPTELSSFLENTSREDIKFFKRIEVALPYAVKLFTENMDIPEKLQLIEDCGVISNIQNGEMIEAIAQHAPKLFTENMDGGEKSQIISAFANIQNGEMIESIAQHAPKLFTENMNGGEKSQIISAFANIQNGEMIESIAQYAPKLFTENIKKEEKIFIIKCLSNIKEVKQLEIIVKYAPQFFTEDMYLAKRLRLIDQLLTIEDLKRLEIIMQYAPKLFTNTMSGYDKSWIGEETGITGEEIQKIEHILQHAPKLFTQNMEEEGKFMIINALDNIKNVEMIVPIAQHAPKLFSQYMYLDKKCSIIKDLAYCADVEMIELIVQHAPKLVSENMDLSQIIKDLGTVKEVEMIEPIVQHAPKFFTEDMYEGEKTNIIESLGHIKSVKKLEIIFSHISELFPKNMSSYNGAKLIETLAKIDDVKKLEAIVQHASKFFTENTSAYEKTNIIETLGQINGVQKLEVVLSHAPKLFTQNMPVWRMVEIIEAFVEIETLQLSKFNERVLNTDKDKYSYLINALKHPNEEIATQILEVVRKIENALNLQEDDLLSQEIIATGIRLANKEDSSNPYFIHKQLVEKREKQADLEKINPLSEVLEGINIQVSPFYLRDKVKSIKPKAKDLPEGWESFYALFRESLKEIDEMAAYEAVSKRIEQDYEFKWSLIKNTHFSSSSHLAAVLQFNNSVTPETEITEERYKFFQIMKVLLNHKEKEKKKETFLQIRRAKGKAEMTDADDKGKEEKHEEKTVNLTSFQDIFLKGLTSIMNCKYGQASGIHDYYNVIVPLNERLTFGAPSLLKEERMHSFCTTVILKAVQDVIGSGTGPMYKEMCGLKSTEKVQKLEGEVIQGAHQVNYVKNLIGAEIGLEERLVFDVYTQCIYKNVLEYTKQEALECFYKYFKPSSLVHTLCQELNKGENKETREQAYKFFASSYPNETTLEKIESYWKLDEEGDGKILEITNKGAIKILASVEALKVKEEAQRTITRAPRISAAADKINYADFDL